MAGPGADRRRWLRLLGYGACGLALWLLSLLLIQALLGRRIVGARMSQLGSEVAFSLRLGELALERYTMEAVAELSGLQLASRPPPASLRGRRQAAALRAELCDRLGYCREVVAADNQLWVEMASALEPVWMAAPLPRARAWPPDPLPLTLSLVAAGLGLSTLVLSLEVRRPLGLLETSLQQLGYGRDPQPVPPRGAAPVRRLTARFNTMLAQLEQARRERETMLAGIGHDLSSPLTRLRLRLHLAESTPMGAADAAKALADLDALERITAQFMAFARGQTDEAAVELDLQAFLAEVAGQCGLEPLALQLEPLRARVRATGLARAVANLLDNARSHGAAPFRLSLRAWNGDGFEIEVADAGPGLDQRLWIQALEPFRRLDAARGGSGHCGLGLAIAERVARAHQGSLHCRRDDAGFTVLLRGRSLGEA
ncbi:ATP-binding protein [Cyanobium sp. CH-040]|uniref:ATP-binding protein n=1 Tax=Cyanobium sp. CH-040 TaxID=2823708 RepID=UPI0020CC5527|nr:ATP-binding protein [Cyanobium sp. CH-040]MCP9929050.1 histidine kinase [Cyanobium sp. CH-040]